MERFARLAAAENIEYFNTQDKSFSSFDFFDHLFGHVECEPLRRILSQAEMHGVRTIVLELLKDSEDISHENKQLAKKSGYKLRSQVYRIGFFSKTIKKTKGLSQLRNSDFIGFAIVKKDQFTPEDLILRVYESVLRPEDNNIYTKANQEWTCLVGPTVFSVFGYIYSQQNSLLDSCAHVALKTVIARYHSGNSHILDLASKLLNRNINEHKNDALDCPGLSVKEMARILKLVGIKCFVANYTEPEEMNYRAPFQRWVYGCIESGYPALVAFSTQADGYGHVIPIFSHTIDRNTWVHRAENLYFAPTDPKGYIPSESWVSMYVGHDSNWGSNYCIPRQFMRTARVCKKEDKAFCTQDNECVSHVISTFPKAVKVSPLKAEAIGFFCVCGIAKDMPDNTISWLNRLKNYIQKGQLILRPVIVEGRNYVEHLRNMSDLTGKQRIPHKFASAINKIMGNGWLWIVEMSVPELYSATQRKIGEVVLNASKEVIPEHFFDNFLMARIPGYIVSGQEQLNHKFDYDFLPCNIADHVNIFLHPSEQFKTVI